jgi:hypothetical protein
MNQEDLLVLLVIFVLGFVVSQMMSGRLVEGDEDISKLYNVHIKTGKDGVEKPYIVTQKYSGEWPYNNDAKITIQDKDNNYFQFTNQNNEKIDVDDLDCGNYFFSSNEGKVQLVTIDACIACLSRGGTVGFTEEEGKKDIPNRGNKFCKIDNKWYNRFGVIDLKSKDLLTNEVYIRTN